MNENNKTAIKNCHLFDKNSQMAMIRYNFKNQPFINSTLQAQLFADVLENCWCSHRCS